MYLSMHSLSNILVTTDDPEELFRPLLTYHQTILNQAAIYLKASQQRNARCLSDIATLVWGRFCRIGHHLDH